MIYVDLKIPPGWSTTGLHKKIYFIKEYRLLTGSTLREAKTRAEEMESVGGWHRVEVSVTPDPVRISAWKIYGGDIRVLDQDGLPHSELKITSLIDASDPREALLAHLHNIAVDAFGSRDYTALFHVSHALHGITTQEK